MNHFSSPDSAGESPRARLAQRLSQRRAPDFQAVHQCIGKHARIHGETIAFQDFQGALTYADLDTRARALAATLAGADVERLVGVGGKLSRAWLETVLAVLYAGAAVLPIDPDDPFSSTRAIHADFHAESATGNGKVLPHKILPQAAAWCLFRGDFLTMVSQRALSQWIAHHQQHHVLDTSDTLLIWASTDSILAPIVLWPLASGARLVCLDREAPPEKAVEVIAQNQVTTLVTTPSRFQRLPASVGSGIKQVITGGEPLSLPKDLARNQLWVPELPGRAVCTASVEEGLRDQGVALLDRHLRPVPLSDEGEVFLSGTGLCRGYHGQPALTASCFLPNPHAKFPGERLFRTLAYARRDRGGDLHWDGEQPHFLLSEGLLTTTWRWVEAIETLVGVDKALVKTRRDSDGVLRVLAYITGTRTYEPEEATPLLPSRLQPDHFIPIQSFPRTSTGHIDEEALATVALADGFMAQRWRRAMASKVEVAALCMPQKPSREEFSVPTGIARAVEGFITRVGRTNHHEEQVPSQVPALREGLPLNLSAYPQTLGAVLQHAAATKAGITYIQDEHQTLTQTYTALAEEASRVQNGLMRFGCQPGDQVILQLAKNEDFVLGFWGCVLAGLVPVPLAVPKLFTEGQAPVTRLQNAWQMLDRPLVLTDAVTQPSIDSCLEMKSLSLESARVAPRAPAPVNTSPQDTALLLLTSGSTGMPKAVVQTHHALIARSAATVQHNQFTLKDISINWMPLDHVGGVVMFHLRDLFLGCHQIHAPIDLVLTNPLLWLDWIDRYQATITWAPNFAYALINDRAQDIQKGKWRLNTMRFILNAGEAIVSRTARRFLQLLMPHGLPEHAMRPAWGMSETCSAVTFSHDFRLETTQNEASFVEVGEPIPGFAMRIVDPSDREKIRNEGEQGVLQVCGASVTEGYLKAGSGAAGSAVADPGAMWFDTGDLGVIHNGRLTITGREKDMIIVHGINYFSHELESLVEEVPGVAVSYTAVFAVREADADTDRVAIVFHIPREESRDAVFRQVRRKLATAIGIQPTWLIPVQIAEIPKTSIGKIQRKKLRQQFLAGAFDAQAVRTGEDKPPTLPKWFFQTQWRPHAIQPKPGKERGRGLILTGDDALGRELGQRLASQTSSFHVSLGTRFQESPFRINLHEPRHFQRLFECIGKEALPQWVVCFWTLGEDHGHEPLIYLARAMARFSETKPRLIVVTKYAQTVASDDPISEQHGVLGGILETIPMEWPGFIVKHVDLDDAASDLSVSRMVREIDSAGDISRSAWRKGRRWSPLLMPFLPKPHGTPPFREGGFYLIAGGHGGIGSWVARLAQDVFKARVLLVGRRPVAEVDKDWIDSDHILYRQLDISQKTALIQGVIEAEQLVGQTLDGIFHLAGDEQLAHHWPISEQRRLDTLAMDSFHRQFNAKMQGSRSLAALLESRPNTTYTAFASVNGFFGGATFAAYAAANSFQIHFNQVLRKRYGDRCRCLIWSMWDNLGMSKDNPDFAREASERAGFSIVTLKEGLQSLWLALQGNQGEMIIGLDARQPRIQQMIPARPQNQRWVNIFAPAAVTLPEIADPFGTDARANLTLVDSFPRNPDGSIDLATLAGQDRSTTTTEFQDPIEHEIAAVWSQVFGHTRFDRFSDFFELGGHSVLLVNAHARLVDRLRVPFTLVEAFQNPTIAQLAAYLRRDHRESDVFDLETLLQRDALLDADIQTQEEETTFPPRVILLTGATGFIGVHLLHELVHVARVWCLIRAQDEISAQKRLQESLTRYQLTLTEKVEIIPGDLAKPRLGLTDSLYKTCADQVDAIVHAGAWVNTAYDYPLLRAANVEGTQEVLRLASTKRTKSVHFISTLGVFPAGPESVDEDTPAPVPTSEMSGYRQSKWVAEQLVMEAGKRGIPTCIYRLGRIFAHRQTGIPNAQDFITLALRACTALGSAPKIESAFALLPVDQLVAAVTFLLQKPIVHPIYHLQATQTTAWSSLVCAEDVEWIDPVQWIEWVRALHHSDAASLVYMTQNGSQTSQFKHSKTQKALMEQGIIFQPIKQDALIKFHKAIRATSF